jgi:hypothetical protein
MTRDSRLWHGRLSSFLRGTEVASEVPRETDSAYLQAAGSEVGVADRGAPVKPANKCVVGPPALVRSKPRVFHRL